MCIILLSRFFPFSLFRSLKVISQTVFVRSCAGDPNYFVGILRRKHAGGVPSTFMRTLQFMCIDWLHQQLMLAFCRDFAELENPSKNKAGLRETVTSIKNALLPELDLRSCPGDHRGLQFLQGLQEKLQHHCFGKALVSLTKKNRRGPIHCSSVSECDLSTETMLCQLQQQCHQLGSVVEVRERSRRTVAAQRF